MSKELQYHYRVPGGSMSKELQYPYISAWGNCIGSYPYYIEDQIQKAKSEKAPITAYTRKHGAEDDDHPRWSTIDEIRTGSPSGFLRLVERGANLGGPCTCHKIELSRFMEGYVCVWCKERLKTDKVDMRHLVNLVERDDWAIPLASLLVGSGIDFSVKKSDGGFSFTVSDLHLDKFRRLLQEVKVTLKA